MISRWSGGFVESSTRNRQAKLPSLRLETHCFQNKGVDYLIQ